jgi:hypothetical protein
MRSHVALVGLFVCLSPGVACIGNAGGGTVDFDVAAAGPADAVAGQPLSFTQEGWDITLTQATLHVGGVYMAESPPVSGGQVTGCYLPEMDVYVAQETSGLDVDLLSPAPQPFPARGHGITQPTAGIGQVWLVHSQSNGADINTASDRMPMLLVAGTAAKNGTTFSFSGSITIGTNHQTSGTLAGGNPICKQRIITPITPAPLVETSGGLLLRIDPRALFNFDFEKRSTTSPTAAYTFSDNPMSWDAVSTDLYMNLHSTAPYSFSWVAGL